MPNLCRVLSVLNQSLAHKENHLDELMEEYYQDRRAWRQDFYKTPINRPEIQACVETLLDSLQLPAHQKSRYLGMRITVHELIYELTRLNPKPKGDREGVLRDFLEKIEQPKRDKRIFLLQLGVIFSAGSSIFMAEGGLSILQGALAMTAFVPALGLIYTLGIAGYSLYQNYYNPNLSFLGRFKENLFLLAHTTLNVAAYSILLAAAAVMTPTAAILCIVAQSVLVAKAGFDLLVSVFSKKRYGESSATDSLEEQHQKIRETCLYEKRRNALGIELGTVVAVTAAIIVLTVMPGGIFVTLPAILGIVLAYAARAIANSVNERHQISQLEKSFTQAETQWEQAKESQRELQAAQIYDLEQRAEHGAKFQTVPKKPEELKELKELAQESSSDEEPPEAPSESGLLSG